MTDRHADPGSSSTSGGQPAPLLEHRRQADQARGVLLGTALGDALGAPFEGRPTVPTSDLREVLRDTSTLRWTDDTAMTVVLADHLVRQLPSGVVVDEQALLLAFAAAYRAEPWRGYGGGPPRIFDLVDRGTPWHEAAAAAYDGGSFGNGGAMRVAPLALALPDPGRLADAARRSASVTHAHPLGQTGAALQAVAVRAALDSAGARLDPEHVLDVLPHHADQEPFVQRLADIRRLVQGGVGPTQAAELLGNGIAALDSVPGAVLAFLLHPDDPLEAVSYAIRMGGDTDTIAAMTGAMAGARCGASALPVDLLARLERVEALRALAGQLSDLTPLRPGREAGRGRPL